LLLRPTGTDSRYEPTSCSFFNIRGITRTARSLGFAVVDQRSPMNLPPYDSAMTGPLPVDRSVFTCTRDRRLDDTRVMGYRERLVDMPGLPQWTAQRR